MSGSGAAAGPEVSELEQELAVLRESAAAITPEMLRLQLENQSLVESLRRYQAWCDEGERQLLADEIEDLRSRLLGLLRERERWDSGDLRKELEAAAAEIAAQASSQLEAAAAEVDRIRRLAREEAEVEGRKKIEAVLQSKQWVVEPPALTHVAHPRRPTWVCSCPCLSGASRIGPVGCSRRSSGCFRRASLTSATGRPGPRGWRPRRQVAGCRDILHTHQLVALGRPTA